MSNTQTRRARPASSPAAGHDGPALRWVHPDPTRPPTLLGSEASATFGRDEACTEALPGTEISRCHAEIVQQDDGFWLRDRNSTNGSFIDGARITSAQLRDGAVVRLGEWIAVFREPPSLVPLHWRFEEIMPGFFAGPTTLAALEPLRRGALSDLPIVIEGETGTGKERVAATLHAWSGRGGPFLAVNCGAIPVTLAESEFFGHHRGAFTGADRARAGHFRSASGGTLFLDEVIDLPATVQVKLLRALEEGQVTPLGESQAVPVDVRIVSAAQTPLTSAVTERGFRADLAARLAGLTVRLPPLRERKEEIPLLFTRFLHTHSGGRAPAVEPALMDALIRYSWPMNIRELQLLARQLLVLHGIESPLGYDHLPQTIRDALEAKAAEAQSATVAREAGPAALVDLLKLHKGNVAKAAAALGLSRQAAYRMLEASGLGAADLDAFREGVRPRSPGRPRT